MAMRHWVRVVRMLLVAVAAYTAALALSAAAALWLEEEPGQFRPARPELADKFKEKPGAAQVNYPLIFERNLFGSEPLPDESATAASPVSQVSLALRGTAQFDGHGFAVFEDSSSGLQDVFAVGERIFDGPKLVGVQSRRAVILQGRRRLTIEISEESDEAPAKQQKVASVARGGIRRTGGTNFLVDRREVEHSIENLSTLVTQMRAVPFLRDGKSIGFRVFNIRPGSLFDRMGLKNGDIVQSVNGTQLDNPSKALTLLDEVQTTDEIRIDLLRDNKPSTYSYKVR